MTRRLAPIPYEDASPELRRHYDVIKERLGVPFIPLWFQVQGAVPRLLAANWAKIEATLLGGDVPRLLKELILYNIARHKECEYCTFTHRHGAEHAMEASGMGGRFEVADCLEASDLPSSYKTAIRVVTRLALDPLATSDADIDELRDEGFSSVELQELLAQADLALLLISVAEIHGVAIDRQLVDAIHQAPRTGD